MIERYGREVMRQVWTEENKFNAYLKVELLAAEAWCELGVVPREDVEKLKSFNDFYFRVPCRPAKVLAVDADNTLWKGIVSEDGAESVVPYAEFQCGLKALRERGVMLALLSKNDPPSGGASPIEKAFAREDMPLCLSDFAFVGVNWEPKAGNLLAAAKALNVGVDSFVFVDDNMHERAQMKAHIQFCALKASEYRQADRSARF